MIYAEALERQVALLRLFSSPEGRHYLEVLTRPGGIVVWGDLHRPPAGAASERPRLPTEVVAERVEEMRKQLLGGLERAETFWWSAELTATAAATAATMPSWTLRLEDAPAPSGFFWFHTPAPLPIVDDGSDAQLKAVSWELIHETTTDRPTMAFWYWLLSADSRYPALPAVSWPWMVGDSLEDAVGRPRLEPRSRAQLRVMCRFTAATWALLAQRLFVAPPQRADRGTARRLKHEGYPHEPLVRVVELRRVEHAGAGGDEPESVEWSCRWVVRGHWRQQPYGPGQAQRRPTWIAPHVKGPDDKPMKAPRATVFAVVR